MRLALEFEDAARNIETVEQARRVVAEITIRHVGEDLPTITIEKFFTEWVQSRKGELALSSWRKYEGTVKGFLVALGEHAKRPLDSLGKQHLVKWRNELAARTRPKTANDQLKIVRTALERAYRDGLVKDNVAKRVDRLKITDEPKRRPFTIDEARSVLEAASGEWRGLILFGLYTAQRLGDIARLRWNNISTDGRMLTFVPEKPQVRKVKNLPLAPPLRAYVRDELPAGDDPEAPLFPDAYRVATVNKGIGRLSHQFRDILIKVGLAKPISPTATKNGVSGKREVSELSFHSFRHTTVTMLKAEGVPESVAMAIAGHSSKAVSQSYTHIDPEQIAAAFERLPSIS